MNGVAHGRMLCATFYCHLDFIKRFTIHRPYFGFQADARNDLCHETVSGLDY